MSDEPKDQRIPIMMSASEVEAIDEWSFQNRIRTRAEAVRRLCQLGMIFDRTYPELMKIVAGPDSPVRRDGQAAGSELEGALLLISKVMYELSKVTLEVTPLKSIRDVDTAIAEAEEFKKAVSGLDWRNQKNLDGVVAAMNILSDGLGLKRKKDQGDS